ncbi:MAG: hypothetical protein ACYDBB_00480 [Armatimonadota bacterium]
MMKKIFLLVAVVSALAGMTLGGALLTGCAKDKITIRNNGTGGGQSSGGTGGAGGGRMSEFREAHKYTFQLSGLVRNIGRLEEDGKQALSKDQAKRLLVVLTPLKTKSKLTQDEAKETIKAVRAILSTAQRDEIAKMKPERQGRRSGQGGEQQRPAGSRPQFDPDAMKDFNPFNPPKDSPMARGAERMQQFFDGLGKKANGK